MASPRVNPFAVTKATFFDDREIADLWSDLPAHELGALLKPTSNTPMLVLGGKGVGKTHLLRLHSYQVQRATVGVENLSYVGIYLRCQTLDVSRFSERRIPDPEQRSALFSTYFELWSSEVLVASLLDLGVEHCHAAAWSFDTASFVASIGRLGVHLGIFDATPPTISELYTCIREQRALIDRAVGRVVFDRGAIASLRAFGAGALLVEVWRACISALTGAKFLLMYDELENFPVEHQKFINSMVRDVPTGLALKVGSRTYGFRTNATLSGERNLAGSEFELLDLDREFERLAGAGSKQYIDFVNDVVRKRIRAVGIPVDDSTDVLTAMFPKDTQASTTTQLLEILSKRPIARRRYVRRLSLLLERAGIAEPSLVALRIAGEGTALEQRARIMEFYRVAPAEVRDSDIDGLVASAASNVQNVLSYFSTDLMAQLAHEARPWSPQPEYLGVQALCESAGVNLRALLNVLRVCVDGSYFAGVDRPTQTRVPISAYVSAVQETSRLYWDDALMDLLHDDEVRGKRGVERLAILLNTIRFSDVVVEPSPFLLSFLPTDISADASAALEAAVRHKLVIRLDHTRRGKNDREERVAIHPFPVLSPIWALPISKRGAIELSGADLETVFLGSEEEFEALKATWAARGTPRLGTGKARPADVSTGYAQQKLFGE